MLHLPMMGKQRASWDGLLDAAQLMPEGWTLVGGQLTFLHLVAANFPDVRPTGDVDTVIDVRGHHPTAVQDFVKVLRDIGFRSELSGDGHQHRWVRGEARIDILIPRGLDSEHSDGRRRGPGRITTVATAGAQFALDRSEKITVDIGDRAGQINRPNLLGALYGKCSALLNYGDPKMARHRQDILALASVTGRSERDALEGLSRRQIQRLVNGLREARSLESGTVSPDTAAGVLAFESSAAFYLNP